MSDEEIARIKAASPIEDVARELGLEVTPRRTARCFRPEAHSHGDRTPSLKLFADGGFTCFGCGIKGTVVDLVMAVRGVTLHEALDWLADRTGLPRSRPGPPVRKPVPAEPPPLCPVLQEVADRGGAPAPTEEQKALDEALGEAFSSPADAAAFLKRLASPPSYLLVPDAAERAETEAIRALFAQVMELRAQATALGDSEAAWSLLADAAALEHAAEHRAAAQDQLRADVQEVVQEVRARAQAHEVPVEPPAQAPEPVAVADDLPWG